MKRRTLAAEEVAPPPSTTRTSDATMDAAEWLREEEAAQRVFARLRAPVLCDARYEEILAEWLGG